MPNRPFLRLFALLPLALLTACASDSTPPPKPLSGEQILRESENMAKIGQRYMDGEKLVKQGEEMVRQGQARITEGEKLIERGRKIMDESEQGYGAFKQ